MDKPLHNKENINEKYFLSVNLIHLPIKQWLASPKAMQDVEFHITFLK